MPLWLSESMSKFFLLEYLFFFSFYSFMTTNHSTCNGMMAFFLFDVYTLLELQLFLHLYFSWLLLQLVFLLTFALPSRSSLPSSLELQHAFFQLGSEIFLYFLQVSKISAYCIAISAAIYIAKFANFFRVFNTTGFE